MIPFKEFIAESLKPLKTEYGWFDKDLNFVKDKIDVNPYYIRAAFKNDNNYYVVYFNLFDGEGELNFSFIKDLSAINKNYGGTTMEPIETKNAIMIFNKVFYLASVLLNKLNEIGNKIDSFEYSGAAVNPKLNKLYRFIFNNKQFLDEMDKIGFVPIKNNDGKIFKFTRSE